jgi:hypothetical protein
MFARGTFQRRLTALTAALLMSSIAVGTAVGPATSVAVRPLTSATYA